MNQIASLLSTENIVARLDVGSKKRLFDEVGNIIKNLYGIPGNVVFDALYAREKLGSTGLGDGIAIPHARIRDLDDPIATFVRLATPIAFDSPDGLPIQLAFVLLVPESANERHLELIAELARMFSDESFRENLRTAPDAASLYRLFVDWQPRS